MTPTGDYIHPVSQSTGAAKVLVIIFNQNFNVCGENSVVQYRSDVVGEKMFDIITSSFLVAWTTGKDLSLLVDGCDGGRAKGYGIRIN